MKIRHLFLAASAAVALSPAAFAATTPAAHCDALQKKFDTEVAAKAAAPGAAKAKDMAAAGEKLCKEGKPAQGVKKLEGALKELNEKAK